MNTKEKVLELIKKSAEKNISGELIAQKCNVSRTAVWKAVNALRKEGYKIEGSTNGGYILTNDKDIFSENVFRSFFSKDYPIFSDSQIHVFNEIDSTNTYAKKCLSECGFLRLQDGKLSDAGKLWHKAIIIAENQTQGRGRLGRTFYSPSKSGIYMSIVYAPEGGITNPAVITAFAAVAVCRAIKKHFNIEPKIKWINDIFINGKKICGILTEGFTNFETFRIESAIVGIGVNIKENNEDVPDEIRKIAGSITGKEDTETGRCELASSIAGEFLTLMELPAETIMEEYKNNSFLIGQIIDVHPVIGDDNSVYKAKVIDIDKNAGLVVEKETGEKLTLNSGEVSLKSYNFV